MRLTELEPKLLTFHDVTEPVDKVDPRYNVYCNESMKAWRAAGNPVVKVVETRQQYRHVQTVAEAQGLRLKCPKCRTHMVVVAFANKGVADHHGSLDVRGRPTRWNVSGSSLEDLTLSPSVDCTENNPKCWHGYITNGEVSIL